MLLRGLIGVVLRRIRIAQSRTLRDVAEAARVSVPYLSEVERGRKEPSSELLAAICSALDLELTDLLAEVRFEIARAELGQRPLTGPTVTGFASLPPGRPEPASSAPALNDDDVLVGPSGWMPGGWAPEGWTTQRWSPGAGPVVLAGGAMVAA